jgi:hypothetical protein
MMLFRGVWGSSGGGGGGSSRDTTASDTGTAVTPTVDIDRRHLHVCVFPWELLLRLLMIMVIIYVGITDFYRSGLYHSHRVHAVATRRGGGGPAYAVVQGFNAGMCGGAFFVGGQGELVDGAAVVVFQRLYATLLRIAGSVALGVQFGFEEVIVAGDKFEEGLG